MAYKFKRKFGFELEFLSTCGEDDIANHIAKVLETECLKESELDYFSLSGYCFSTSLGSWYLIKNPDFVQKDTERYLLVSPLLFDVAIISGVFSCLEQLGCWVSKACNLCIKWDTSDLGLSDLLHILSRTVDYQFAMLKQFEVGVTRVKYCKRFSHYMETELFKGIEEDRWESIDQLVKWFIELTVKESRYTKYQLISYSHPSRGYIVSLYGVIIDNIISFNFFNSTLDIDRLVQYLYFLEDMYLKEDKR